MAMEGDRIKKRQWEGKLFWRLLRFGMPYMRLILLGVFLIIVAQAAAVLSPVIIKHALDENIIEGDFDGLNQTVLFFVCVILVQGVATFLQAVCTQLLGQKVMYDLRNRIFEHLQRLSVSYFDKNPVGRLITRVTSDVENLNQLFTEGIVAIFGDLFLIVGIVAAMFYFDARLALWAFAVLPLLVLATFVFRHLLRKAFDDVRFHLARINANLQENIVGTKTVQLFLREAKNLEIFRAVNRDHTRAHERTILCFATFYPLVETLLAGALALVIYQGGKAMGAGTLTFGTLFLFIKLLEMFFRPLGDLAEKYNIVQSAVISSERIFHLLDRVPEVTDRTGALQAAAPVKRIEFDNVTFGYDPENPVLRNISFSVESGESVALVGHTGAGKTTVINLLQRFYDIQEGAIRINGEDVRNVTQRSLRELMVAVQQDPFIFSRRIGENIRLGEEGIGKERMESAARLVNAASFIEKLPEKYDTELVERGDNLSTGQKQLLSFARAMAFDPEILILDEATANIDTPTEALIQSAIAELTRKRTSILIAHRLSTIQNADKILVFHRGEKVEEGNHQELLELRGLYWRLYQLQYKEERLRHRKN